MALQDPTTWSQQAAMANAGQWEDLKAWQAELVGGVPPAAIGTNGSADDLTRIEGIGPKISEVLALAGIRTFSELSSADVESIKKILADAGGHFATHDPGTWPAQAAMAADGRWDELQAWQEQLQGGREA